MCVVVVAVQLLVGQLRCKFVGGTPANQVARAQDLVTPATMHAVPVDSFDASSARSMLFASSAASLL